MRYGITFYRIIEVHMVRYTSLDLYGVALCARSEELVIMSVHTYNIFYMAYMAVYIHKAVYTHKAMYK